MRYYLIICIIKESVNKNIRVDAEFWERLLKGVIGLANKHFNLIYALKNNEITYIEDVERGLKCNCLLLQFTVLNCI